MTDDTIQFYLDGVVNFLVCGVGLAINTIAIAMLLRTGGARARNNSVYVKCQMQIH